MSNSFFDYGVDAFANAGVNWTSDTIKGALLDMTVSSTGCKQITGASNATPIVITAASHGFATGDIVVINGVVGNTAANGTFKVGTTATNTFQLLTLSGQNTTGNGGYSSGGSALDLSLAEFWGDLNAGLIGTPVALTTKSTSKGILTADSLAFVGVTGNPAQAVILYKDTGVAGTSRLILFVDGKTQVTVDKTASTSDTTVFILPLVGTISSGATLVFSNGQSATLTAQANPGDRSLSVSALSGGIPAGHQADASTQNVGLPITPPGGGGNFTIVWDTGTYKIAALAVRPS